MCSFHVLQHDALSSLGSQKFMSCKSKSSVILLTINEIFAFMNEKDNKAIAVQREHLRKKTSRRVKKYISQGLVEPVVYVYDYQ